MKLIFSILLFAFFIQNSLASTDYNITIVGLAKTSYDGCKINDENPLFRFSLNVIAYGLKEETEWKIRVGQFSYASCEIYPRSGKQIVFCGINIRVFPVKKVKFTATYSPYDQRSSWTVTGWENIANKEIFSGTCYPEYSYSFVPNSKIQPLVECHSTGANKVTLYGKFTALSKNLRRLSVFPLEISQFLIVDGALFKTECRITSEDSIVCPLYGKKYFQFFTTVSYVNNGQSILVEESNKFNLIDC